VLKASLDTGGAASLGGGSEGFCSLGLGKTNSVAIGGSGFADVGCGDRLSPSHPRTTSTRAATTTNFGLGILELDRKSRYSFYVKKGAGAATSCLWMGTDPRVQSRKVGGFPFQDRKAVSGIAPPDRTALFTSKGPEFARCGASRIQQNRCPRRHAAIES